MKRKTIKAVLAKKHAEFVKSIENEEVRKLVDKNSIITGGCIASMLLREKVNDFDYYFTDIETVRAVARYYVNKYKSLNHDKVTPIVEVKDGRVRIRIQSAGVTSEGQEGKYQYFEQSEDPLDATTYVDEVLGILKQEGGPEEDGKPKYRPVFLSDNAITLSDKIQLVIRFYGEPEQIHSNYDFVHCTGYWVSKTGELVLPADALESLLARELIYAGSKYPLASVIRTRKFINRGWTVNAGQYLKMIMQISDLDLTDMNVLEDQLVGMDVAYFQQVIDYLKERQEKDADFKLTSAYLIEVIDRMF
jgi:hypothetical protein